MKTLFIFKTLTGSIGLRDANKAHIGWFNSVELAQAFCDEMGYKWRME